MAFLMDMTYIINKLLYFIWEWFIDFWFADVFILLIYRVLHYISYVYNLSISVSCDVLDT